MDLLLKAGGALVILFAGWAIDHHQDFDLGWISGVYDTDRRLAAAGLLLMSLVYALFLPLSVWKIYNHRLQDSQDPTLLPRRVAMWISVTLSLGAVLIAGLMSVL